MKGPARMDDVRSCTSEAASGKNPERPKNGFTREQRQRKVVEKTIVFLRSVCEQSDRAVRMSKLTRNDTAQAQYDLARVLAQTLENEFVKRDTND